MKRSKLLFLIAALAVLANPAGGLPPVRMPKAADREVVGRYLQDNFRLAQAELKSGNAPKALRILDAIATLRPGGPLTKKIKPLRVKCNRAIFQSMVLVGTATAGKRFYTSGEAVAITFRLRNVSKHTVRIPTHETVEKRFLLPDIRRKNNRILIKHKKVDLIIAGSTVRSFENPQYMTIPKEIVLKPGEEWKMTFDFATVPRRAEAGILRTIRVVGSFRPLFLLKDEKTEHRHRFVFKPVTVTILPKGYEKYIDVKKPLQSMKEGLAEKKPLKVFYAASILPEKEKGVGLAMLIETLRKSKEPKMTMTALSSLALLSGQYFGHEKWRWFAWWQTVKEGYLPKGGKAE